jgi:hypothetical protein
MRFLKLSPSTRKDKRFMYEYIDEFDKKKRIHFGFKGGQTFLEHNDIKKKDNYLKRHSVNEDWTKLNAGSLARFLLWNGKSLEKNLKEFNAKFIR